MPVVDLEIRRGPAPVVRHRNSLVITSKFMHGDDDFNEAIVTEVHVDQKAVVVDFLNFLEATDRAIKNNQYQDSVAGYERFGYDESTTFEFGLDGGWPIDTNTSVEASYRGSSIEYYDADGNAHRVLVRRG